MQASLLIYDIPVATRFPNPSNRLRRLAVRVNLSAWVVLNEHIPWTILDDLTQGGVQWRMVKFDEKETDTLLFLAEQALKHEVEEGRKRLAKSMERADERLETSQVVDGETHPVKKYEWRVNGNLRRAEKLLVDAEACAKLFKVDAAGLNIGTAWSEMEKIKSHAETQAFLYAQMVERLGDRQLAEAARNANVPPLVLADAVEDEGGDATAARLAFNQNGEMR